MAFLNLGAVTDSLLKLIEESIKASPAWLPALPLDVTAEPPDKLSGDSVVGLYLFHVSEDAHHKNTLPRAGTPPQRFSPLPLNLHFQLCAHSDLAGKSGPLREQLLMGLAMKALHDYPYLNSDSVISGTSIYVPELREQENPLRITLQPMEASDAVHYWTAGSNPLRLAAYYQVGVGFIEGEALTLGGGPILVYNTPLFASSRPHIQATRNLLEITLPGESQPRRLELSPAQAPYGGRLELVGSGFTGGRLELRLRRAGWRDGVEVGGSWGLFGNGNQLNVIVQRSAEGTLFLPGVYTAEVNVIKIQRLASGGEAELPLRSNPIPFLLAPAFDSATAPDASGLFIINGGIFQDTDLAPESVAVQVAEGILPAGTAGALNPGEFAVLDADRIEVRLPAGFASGAPIPVKVAVDGAESRPQWVIAP